MLNDDDDAIELLSKNKIAVFGLVAGIVATMMSGVGWLLGLLLPLIGLAVGSFIGDPQGVVHGMLGDDKPPRHWTPDYVRQHVMRNDRYFDDLVTKHIAKPAQEYMGASEKGRQVLADFNVLAKKMGVVPAPQILIMNDAWNNAGAEASDTGKTYILFGKDVYDRLDRKEIMAVLAHELGHIQNGDVFAEGIAATHNAPDKLKYKRQREFRADLAGAQATHDYHSNIGALRVMDQLSENQSDHPSNEARQYYLAENDPTEIKAPHTPPTAKPSIKNHGKEHGKAV